MTRKCSSAPASATSTMPNSGREQERRAALVGVVDAVHADHHQLGVADPHHVDDAEDQVEAERQQRQQAGEQDAVEHGLQEEDVELAVHPCRVICPLASCGRSACHQIPMYALRMSSLAASSAAEPRGLDAADLEQVGAVDHLQHLRARSARRSAPCSPRRGCAAPGRTPAPRSPAQAPSTARRAARAWARSSARGRWRTSAARRPTWCRRAARAAPSGAGNSA